MSLRAAFYDKRNRNLAVLAAIAVLTLLLAAISLDHRESVVAPKYQSKLLFPGLAHALNAGEVTHIRIASKQGGTFDVAFVPTKGWVLPQRGNFPAAFEEVNKTLVAIAALETVEPKTDRPDLFHFVGLDSPPDGDGIAITLSGEKGHVLAALIVGKTAPGGGVSGIGLFVRKANENQSWLAKSPSEFKPNPSDWLDKMVVSIDRARVARVDVQPESGPSYSVSRPAPAAENFTVAPLPKGRELAYAGAGDAIGSSVTDFAFDDIKPANAFDFEKGARVVTRTVDGLTVTVDLVKQGNDYWARVAADAAPGKPQIAKQANGINSRAAGWAFKLPAYRGPSFAPLLETLLKPRDTAKPRK